MPAVQFVVLLVLTTVPGAGILIYTAHVFATVAQQTAGGLDEIAWPKDPWYDWIGRALHLGWLVAFWLVPLGFLLRAVGAKTLAASAALYVGVPAALFWLLFPVTLLSSFSANSPWVLLRPEALRRMARGASATAAFYLLTAPLCLLGAGALYLTLALSRVYALPVLPTVLFVYARLIGRYSRVLGRVRLKGAKPKADPEVRRAARRVQVVDPWGTPDEAPKEDRPRKKKQKPARADTRRTDEAETYGVANDEPPRRAERQKPPPEEEKPPRRGKSSAEPVRVPSEAETPLPAHPLLDGVFTFPWYPAHLGAWGLLTLLFLGWSALYALMQSSAGILK